jgi:hypothetical protein
VSSTLGTILVSVTAVWLATSANAPVRPDADAGYHSSSGSSSQPLYHLSPVPAGADWTS